jgi:hypothetical protein
MPLCAHASLRRGNHRGPYAYAHRRAQPKWDMGSAMYWYASRKIDPIFKADTYVCDASCCKMARSGR